LLLEAVTVALCVCLVRRNRPRLAGYAAISVLGAELVSVLIKEAVSRVRPCVDAASCPDTTSFPSGHSVGAAAFWTTVAVLLLPRVGQRAWVLLAIPLLVALTRVLLGVHYPSDVVAGLLVGGCWAAAATALLSGWRSETAHRDVPLEEVAR
jgi:undecaprenyl-diphosphatase